MVALISFRPLAAPEIQGTTDEVAREKCRRAAELVSQVFLVTMYASQEI